MQNKEAVSKFSSPLSGKNLPFSSLSEKLDKRKKINKYKLSVTRSEIINKLAKNFPNIYKKDINKLFDIFLFEVLKALSNSERVELRDVMTFEPRIQKKRVSLNPKTLEKVEVPEKKSIVFKCSKEWKKRINEKI